MPDYTKMFKNMKLINRSKVDTIAVLKEMYEMEEYGNTDKCPACIDAERYMNSNGKKIGDICLYCITNVMYEIRIHS